MRSSYRHESHISAPISEKIWIIQWEGRGVKAEGGREKLFMKEMGLEKKGSFLQK